MNSARVTKNLIIMRFQKRGVTVSEWQWRFGVMQNVGRYLGDDGSGGKYMSTVRKKEVFCVIGYLD